MRPSDRLEIPTSTGPYVVLGCGAAKRSLGDGETCAAVDLYTGPLYLARLAYARALGGPHTIVSARYGAIDPCEPLPAYNLDLRALPKREREAWTSRVTREIARRCPPERPIVALVSGPYADWCADLASPHRNPGGRTITIPARGMTLGMQRRELARLTEAARAAA